MTSALRKKLLSLAIRGKLVPQDPADEPASILLERIRAERESKENAAPRRGRGRRSSSDNPPCPKRGMSVGTAELENAVFEPPFPIPKSWTWCRLGNVIEAINGLAFKPTDWKDSGLPIVRIQNLNDSSASFNFTDRQIPDSVHLYGGELLFAWSGTPGTSFGAHIWQYREAALNQHIFKLVFSEDLFDKRYLKIALNNLVERFIEQAHGGVGLAHITRKVFDDIAIPIPPMREQRHIVEQYENIATLCECVDRNYSELQSLSVVLKSHILDIAIRGDLVPQDLADEPASVLLDRIRITADKPPCTILSHETLFQIPESWVWTTLDNVICPTETTAPSGTTFTYIDIDAIDNKENTIKDPKTLLTAKAPSRARRRVSGGDTIFSMVRPYLRNIAKVPRNLSGATASTGFFVCRPSEALDENYLFDLMRSNYVVDGLNQFMKGDNSPSISGNHILKFPIPLPPLAEQRRIAEKVNELFASIDSMITK